MMLLSKLRSPGGAAVALVMGLSVVALASLVLTRGQAGDHDVPDVSVPSAQPAAASVLITATSRTREGEEWIDVAYFDIAVSNLVTTSAIIRINNEGVRNSRFLFAAAGSGSLTRVQDESTGRIIRQHGTNIRVALPPFLMDISPLTHADWRQFPLESAEYGIIDVSILEQLIQEDVVTATEQTSYLGIPATQYTTFSQSNPAWRRELVISDEHGVIFELARFASDHSEGLDSRFSVEEIDLDADTESERFSAEYFTLAPEESAPTFWIASSEFNPLASLEAPVAQSGELLFPSALPLSGGYEIDQSVFVSGASDEVKWPKAPTVFGQINWLVASQFVSESASVLVIQGLESMEYTPIALPGVWPPTEDDDVLNNGVDKWLLSSTPRRFQDSVPALFYTANPRFPMGLDGGDVSPVESVGTWTAGDIRVLILCHGLDIDEAFDWAEEFRSSSAQ